MHQSYHITVLTSLVLALSSCGSPNSLSSNLFNGTATPVKLSGNLLGSQSATLAKGSGDDGFTVSNFDGNITSAQASIERVEIYYLGSCSDFGLTNSSDDNSIDDSNHHKDGADDGVNHDINDDHGGDRVTNCENETEHNRQVAKLRLQGPFVLDLLTGSTTPSLASLQLPAGTAIRVDVRLDDKHQLNSSSLIVSGNYNANGVSNPFSISYDFNEEIKFRNDSGFEISAAQLNCMVMGLDVEKWFAGVDLSQHDNASEQLLRNNIEHSFMFFSGSCDTQVSSSNSTSGVI